MLKHNTSHNLLKVDVSRLQDANVDFICGDAENLLSRVTTLVSLVNSRVKKNIKMMNDQQ